jgi:hypothetical protein
MTYLIFYDILVTVTGIVNLAPLSLPVTVNVAYSELEVPKSVFTVVAVIFKVVPTTVLDTFVPNVVVVFAATASVVWIPVAV